MIGLIPLNGEPNLSTVDARPLPPLPTPAIGEPLPDSDPPTAEELLPAHLTRTSREMLGQRGLPRLLQERPTVYVLGPGGVGKTSVGRRLCGEDDRVEVNGAQLRRALIGTARRGSFPPEWYEAPSLLVDDVDFLYNRYGAVGLVGRLLRTRAEAGRRTVLCQGPSDSSITLLYSPVPLKLRASLLLRFPVGKGRRTHVKNRCLERGIDPTLAAEATRIDPWTYSGVEAVLDRVAAERAHKKRRP